MALAVCRSFLLVEWKWEGPDFISDTSPAWHTVTWAQWILMLWYVTAGTLGNDLLGCTSDWTTAQLATWQRWGGIAAQTGKEGETQKNSISSANPGLAQTSWSSKKKRFQFLNIPQWKWKALGEYKCWLWLLEKNSWNKKFKVCVPFPLSS